MGEDHRPISARECVFFSSSSSANPGMKVETFFFQSEKSYKKSFDFSFSLSPRRAGALLLFGSTPHPLYTRSLGANWTRKFTIANAFQTSIIDPFAFAQAHESQYCGKKPVIRISNA